MDLQLRDKTAVIVGGAGLLGRSIAATLLGEQCRVVLAGRTPDSLQAVASTLRSAYDNALIETVVVDTTDHTQLHSSIAAAADLFGGLDILVNSGAPAAGTLSGDEELETTRSAFEVKALGYLASCRAALPHLRSSSAGRIINICGQSTHHTGAIPTTVRNAAVVAISKNLADELASEGITVNTVHPGLVVADDELYTPQPGRPGVTTPSAVAAYVAFLASPRAATISGTAVDVGHSMMGFTAL